MKLKSFLQWFYWKQELLVPAKKLTVAKGCGDYYASISYASLSVFKSRCNAKKEISKKSVICVEEDEEDMPKKFNIKAYDDDSSDDYIDMSDVKYKVLSSKQSLQTRRDSRMSRDRKKRSKSSKKGSNTESVVSDKKSEKVHEKQLNATKKAKTIQCQEVSRVAEKRTASMSNFITSRRLTTGVSGIFGNSRASDVVRRRGAKNVIDLQNRKTSHNIKQKIEQTMEKILKGSSRDASTSGSVAEENDRTWEEATPMSCRGLSTGRNSSGSKSLGEPSPFSMDDLVNRSGGKVKTPCNGLPFKTPLIEISQNLQASLNPKEIFKGRDYLGEVQDELRKLFKQDLTLFDKTIIVKRDMSTPGSGASASISVANRNSSSARSTGASVVQSEQRIAEIPKSEQDEVNEVRQSSIKRDSTADNYLELPMSSSECSSSAVLRTKSNDKLSEISSDNTNAKPIEENRQRTTMDHQYSNSWQDIQNQFPVLHRDRQNVMGKTKVTYETSDHVDGHYAEDSGTYSTQSSSKDFVTRPSEPRTATHVYPGSINALPSYETFGVNNPQNVADPAVTCGAVTTVNKCEPNRKETFDHDLTYAQHGFDILDYAGQLPVMEERVFSSRNSDINDDFISRPPKKPRSESPSPRLKMYRMKMF